MSKPGTLNHFRLQGTRMNLQKPDILTTIEKERFKPIQKGKSFWLSCPFHADKTPSFKIDTDKQRFYCFGCGASGDSISFIQRLNGSNFKEALQYLNLQEPLKINSEQQKKRALVNDFREREKSLKKELTDFVRDFYSVTRDLKTWEEVEELVEDFQLISLAEYFLEILSEGTDRQKYNLIKGMKKNG